jgi:hypothetical protein
MERIDFYLFLSLSINIKHAAALLFLAFAEKKRLSDGGFQRKTRKHNVRLTRAEKHKTVTDDGKKESKAFFHHKIEEPKAGGGKRAESETEVLSNKNNHG